MAPSLLARYSLAPHAHPGERTGEGKQPLHERVYDWLARRRTEAFTLDEIIGGMTGADPSIVELVLALMSAGSESTKAIEAEYASYKKAMQALEEDQRINPADEGGRTYYYIVERR